MLRREGGNASVSQLNWIETDEEFQAVLDADRAILFFWVAWSRAAIDVQYVVEKWLETHKPFVAVHRVHHEDLPLVEQWLAEQGKEYLGYAGVGHVAWLRAGRPVTDL